MDPGCLSLSLCVMMACLLGAVALSSDDNTSCPCPRIPTLKLSEPPEQRCYQIDERYRYQCVEGYVREAGTSSLTRCRRDEHGDLHWITPTLVCIPDPNRPIPPTPPLNTRAATATPTSQQTTWNTTVSEDGGTNNVEPTTHGEEDSGTSTSKKPMSMQNSTFSPRITSSSTTSPPGANKGKIDSVTQTKGMQTSTVSQSNANRSTTTSPGVRKAAPPTRLQTNVTESTFNSVTGQDSMDVHGGIHSVTQSVVKNQTTTSTISPSTDTSNAISSPGARKDLAQAMGISASLVIICALIGISIFLYRRRSTSNIPQQTLEELRPINPPPAVPEPV